MRKKREQITKTGSNFQRDFEHAKRTETVNEKSAATEKQAGEEKKKKNPEECVSEECVCEECVCEECVSEECVCEECVSEECVSEYKCKQQVSGGGRAEEKQRNDRREWSTCALSSCTAGRAQRAQLKELC